MTDEIAEILAKKKQQKTSSDTSISGSRQPSTTGSIEDAPFGVAMQLFRTPDFAANAQNMGFDVQQGQGGNYIISRGNETYQVNPADISNRILQEGRMLSQGLGAIGGMVAAAPSGPIGMVGGSTAGGMMGGQAYDLLAETLEPGGRSVEQNLSQAARDAQGELIASLGGEIAGDVMARGGRKLLGDATQGARDMVTPTREAVEPRLATQTAEQIQAQPEIRQNTQNILETMTTGKPQEIVEAVMPRPEVVRAAREEGIELTEGAISGNPAFIDAFQAVKSTPGSKIAAQEAQNIEALGQRVSELKQIAGGSDDVALMNREVADKFDASIQDLQSQAGKYFDEVRNTVPERILITPENVVGALKEEIRRVNGAKNLDGVWLDIYKDLRKNTPEGASAPRITYGFLDNLRKKVGAGYKGKGAFKDADTGQLDEVYGLLSQDQKQVLQGIDGDLLSKYELANSFTQSYKNLQEDALKFGKAVVDKDGKVINAPFVNKVSSALKQAANGNDAEFIKLVDALPTGQRAPVVMSAIDSLFSSKTLKTGDVTGTSKDAAMALARNKTAKDKIYSYLPKEIHGRLDNLFVISDGIFTAKARENTSRTARDVIREMDKQVNMLARLYGTAKTISPTARVSGAVAEQAGKGTKFEQVIMSDSNTARKADDMLSSPKFKQAMDDFLKGEVDNVFDITKMPEYQQWYKTLTKDTQQEIRNKGFFNYLFGTQSRGDEQSNLTPYQMQTLQARIAQGDPTAIRELDKINQANAEREQMAVRQEANNFQTAALNYGTNFLEQVGAKNDMALETALDIRSMASRPLPIAKQLIDDLYEVSGVPQNAPIAKAFADIYSEMGEASIPFKNVLQNNGLLPPDDKSTLINKMIAMGTNPDNAVKTANTLNKLNKKTSQQVIAAIKSKIPDGQYKTFKPLIDSIEAAV